MTSGCSYPPLVQVFGSKAWLKALLHVCKHASSVVGGFLLSNGDGDFVDAVPVFHGVPTPAFLEYAKAAVRRTVVQGGTGGGCGCVTGGGVAPG